MYELDEIPEIDPARQAALVQTWAGLLGRRDVLILDTETTGLGEADIVDIGIIDTRGYRRMDRLIMPGLEIDQEAQRVHGITREQLIEQQAPPFRAVFQRIRKLLDGADEICIYNADFDLGCLAGSARRAGVWDGGEWFWTISNKTNCIMHDYALLHGVWHDYWEGWAWCKLIEAAHRESVPSTGAHRALFDCKMVLGIMRAVVARGKAA